MKPSLYCLVLVLAGCALPEREQSADWFQDEAADRGLVFTHESGFEGPYRTPEIMGGGAALLDADGDGDLDAYLVQGGDLFGERQMPPANQLFINRGDGQFEAVDSGDGADRRYGMGVATGDYDGDGDPDLYLTNWGRNTLLRNDGGARFTDVTEAAGVGHSGWGTAAAFADLDDDGDLDLFVVNYLNWQPGSAQDCIRTYCAPTPDDATADVLYRNDGNGTFTDVSARAGLNTAFGNGLGIAAADFDGDGRTDIFVANDGMVNQLWLNRGDLRFSDEALLWGVAMDDHGFAKAGMGVAAGDVDDDLDVDVLVVNLEQQTDSLYVNAGSHFVDATARFGLGVVSRRYTRFGVVLTDFDNDGDLDLYQSNGRIDHTPGPDAGSDPFAQPNVLYGHDADGFSLREGVTDPGPHTSRGVASGDVDGDGGIDLLVVNRDAPAYLLMNRLSGRGEWLRFRVLGPSGAAALGAEVYATIGGIRRRRDVQTAGSYLSASDPAVHFGLGQASGVTGVEVRWPGGEHETFGEFPASGTFDLRFGAGTPVR